MNHYFTLGQNLNQFLITIHFAPAVVMGIQRVGHKKILTWLQCLKGKAAHWCDLWEACRPSCR